MNFESLKEIILKFIPKTNQEAELLVREIIGILNDVNFWIQNKFIGSLLPAVKFAGNTILLILEKVADVIRWLLSLLP